MINVRRLLEGLVDASVLQNLDERPEALMDVPLSHLGIDSVASMVIIDRLEEDFGVEIDFESFVLDDIGTVRRLLLLVGGSA